MKHLLSENLERDGDYYFRGAFRILGTREEAEDAIQDAFLAALDTILQR